MQGVFFEVEMQGNGVFSKWSGTFIEFREFRESEESLKHELGSVLSGVINMTKTDGY